MKEGRKEGVRLVSEEKKVWHRKEEKNGRERSRIRGERRRKELKNEISE